MTNLKEIFKTNENNNIILAGDFNFPDIKWKKEKHQAEADKNNLSYQATEFLNLIERYSLEQYVEAPTRKNNVLDLIFTNNENLINSTFVYKSIISDHKIIECTSTRILKIKNEAEKTILNSHV